MRVFAIAVAMAMAITASAQASDKILATWSDGWYPGTVTGRVAGNFRVIFDDGDQAVVPPSGVRPLDWTKGTRLQCNWLGRGIYYWGVVSELSESKLSINYDDGDRENTIIGRCRVPFKR